MSSYNKFNKFLKNKKNKALQAYRYRRTYKASLSVEAALCFSLLIIALAILIMPFDMMNTNRKIRGIAEGVCKDVSQYAYTYNRLKNNPDKKERENLKDTDNYDSAAMEKVKGIFAGGALGTYVASKIKADIADKNISNITGIFSTCMADGEIVNVRIDYDYGLPINILGRHTVAQTVVASRRAWIGADGGKGENAGDAQSDDEYVYIGKNSTRYHTNLRCHYLYNDLHSVSISDINSIRNENGAIYHPCERCGNCAGSTVYVMPSGTKYHTSPYCTAIIAYVQKVKKSEVEHLGACSYCGGGH